MPGSTSHYDKHDSPANFPVGPPRGSGTLAVENLWAKLLRDNQETRANTTDSLTALLRLYCVWESTRDLVKNADSDSGGLGWRVRFCISNQLVGDAETVSLQIPLRVTRVQASKSEDVWTVLVSLPVHLPPRVVASEFHKWYLLSVQASQEIGSSFVLGTLRLILLLGDLMADSAFTSLHSRLQTIFLFVSRAWFYVSPSLGVSYPHLSSCSSWKPSWDQNQGAHLLGELAEVGGFWESLGAVIRLSDGAAQSLGFLTPA